MSVNLTTALQNVSGRDPNYVDSGTSDTQPVGSKQVGTVLSDTTPAAISGKTNVIWQADVFGNISACVAAASAPSGAANLVYATPNGTAGNASLRALVEADLPSSTAFTNTANAFSDDQTLDSGAGLVLQGSHEWRIFSNPGSQTLFIQDVSNGTYYPLVIHSNDGATPGLEVVSNAGYTFSGGSAGQSADTSIMRPSAAVVQIGDGGANSNGVLAATFFCSGVGAQLSAAATLTLTHALHHVTGATAITSIDLPANAVVVPGTIATLIADSATITFSTGGNIAFAGTISLNNAKSFVYDGTNWYPVS